MIARKLVVLILILISFGTLRASDIVGQKAPEITIDRWITAGHPDLANLTGKVVVVEFWATWCHPCVQLVPELIDLNNKYASEGFVLISLSQDKSADLVAKFVSDKAINYPVALDRGTADWFGVTGYPTVFVIDHTGKVCWKGFPWDSDFTKAIEKAIDSAGPPLLAGLELGTFKKYKKALFGGKDFADAYLQIASYAGKDDSQNSALAKQIVSTIDSNITEMLADAEKIKANDPLAAYSIYELILSKYNGITVSDSAKDKYIELAKYIKSSNPSQIVAKKIDLTTEE